MFTKIKNYVIIYVNVFLSTYYVENVNINAKNLIRQGITLKR